jgi:GalNAc-alpha-(1->4)-GalNAc-alpha-(1->3)-diNAcBac-PP-undecaprenol alpha-1,4-N-acetyl-D-galactosaminyltransferase
MRVTLIIYAITAGGAERVMSIMANYWANTKWQVTLLSFDDGKTAPFYELDSRIVQVPLNIAGTSSSLIDAIIGNYQRVRALRSAIIDSQPDVIISFTPVTNILTLLAARSIKAPVVVGEHNYPPLDPIGKIWDWLRWKIYPQADRIVPITQRILDCFPDNLKSKSLVIPNPVLAANSESNSTLTLLKKPSLIAMGRFAEQKGFDLLLPAFAKLAEAYPDWNLTILGDGDLRPELETLRDRLGLQERVSLPGRVKNPYDFLKQADIFVMPSRHEGFPMSLCEAMACGLAVISTDCPSGPAEIIQEGVDGLLVPTEDVSALADAMERLISNEEERKSLAESSLAITQRFGLEKIMGIWETLIAQLTKKFI